MKVTSIALQERLDQWDHMFRFGINVPDYFLVHDIVSLGDLFDEYCEKHELDRLVVHRFERDSDEEPDTNLPTMVETLKNGITEDHLSEYYYLVTPYIDVNEFVITGWVKSPTVNDPFDMEFGYREDHKIPFDVEMEDGEIVDREIKVMHVDHRNQIPHSNPYFGDLKRIAMGFPYQGCRLTWSVTKSRIGRNQANLCFWDYQVDETYFRD